METRIAAGPSGNAPRLVGGVGQRTVSFPKPVEFKVGESVVKDCEIDAMPPSHSKRHSRGEEAVERSPVPLTKIPSGRPHMGDTGGSTKFRRGRGSIERGKMLGDRELGLGFFRLSSCSKRFSSPTSPPSPASLSCTLMVGTTFGEAVDSESRSLAAPHIPTNPEETKRESGGETQSTWLGDK